MCPYWEGHVEAAHTQREEMEADLGPMCLYIKEHWLSPCKTPEARERQGRASLPSLGRSQTCQHPYIGLPIACRAVRQYTLLLSKLPYERLFWLPQNIHPACVTQKYLAHTQYLMNTFWMND